MKRCNLIKRFFIGLLLIVVASISANAQEGLYVKSIFQRFGHAKGCKMVTMQNAQLKGHRLKIYKSLVYKNHATAQPQKKKMNPVCAFPDVSIPRKFKIRKNRTSTIAMIRESTPSILMPSSPNRILK